MIMKILNREKKFRQQSGFTLMEIIVATTLFAFTTVALTTLFNYVLKINRRAEVLRQGTQSMRDFVELVAKEVRNGQLDYGVSGGTTVLAPVSNCPTPPSSDSGTLTTGQSLSGLQNVRSSYQYSDNRLGVIDTAGDRWCFFLGDENGNYVGVPADINDGARHQGKTLMVQKNTGGTAERINPPNTTINYLAFFIRPICDPYVITCQDYGNKAPKIQPFVTIAVNFKVTLPTGETKNIYYQTSVSTDRYDVPNTP